jgi:hypothetical protein
MSKGYSLHTRVGNDHIEGFAFSNECVSTGAHALQICEIQLNKFEASAVLLRIPLDLSRYLFRLGQIPGRTLRRRRHAPPENAPFPHRAQPKRL